eukprot:1781177-Amphidinium_carterae.1
MTVSNPQLSAVAELHGSIACTGTNTLERIPNHMHRGALPGIGPSLCHWAGSRRVSVQSVICEQLALSNHSPDGRTSHVTFAESRTQNTVAVLNEEQFQRICANLPLPS